MVRCEPFGRGPLGLGRRAGSPRPPRRPIRRLRKALFKGQKACLSFAVLLSISPPPPPPPPSLPLPLSPPPPCLPSPSPPPSPSPSPGARQRQCLSHDGSGTTRQRGAVTNKAKMPASSPQGQWNDKTKTVSDRCKSTHTHTRQRQWKHTRQRRCLATKTAANTHGKGSVFATKTAKTHKARSSSI